MNSELLAKIYSEHEELMRKDKELRSKYAKLVSEKASAEDLNKIAAEIISVDKQIEKHKANLKAYRDLYDKVEATKAAYNKAQTEFNNFEKKLLEEYQIVKPLPTPVKPVDPTPVKPVEPTPIEEEPEEPEVVKEKESKAGAIILGSLIGATTLATAVHTGIILHDKNVEKDVDDDEETKEEEEETNKPFEAYGDFTDVTDDEQVQARAQWYYDTFLAKQANNANPITVEDLANDIRVYNGEFKQDESGNKSYNNTDVVQSSIDLHTIANYDSVSSLGNNIRFTPTAPLFVDGSLAQKGAIDLDNAMAKVVKAINADDKEAFVEASKEWGKVVVSMFDYEDMTGKYVGIHQVDAPASFPLFHAMNSKYASTILEYSEANHLPICIPYCIDYCTNETQDVALSEIMYNLNERNIDAVAVRSGNLKEYERNNVTLPEDLCLSAQEYFNSKFDLEIGHARSLTK